MTTALDTLKRDKIITKVVSWANKQFAAMVKDHSGDLGETVEWLSRPMSSRLADSCHDHDVDLVAIIRDMAELHDLDSGVINYSALDFDRPVIDIWFSLTEED